MGSFKDFDKKAPVPGAQPGERKNDEETGEPVQLPGDASEHQQPQKPGKSGKRKQADQQQQVGQQPA